MTYRQHKQHIFDLWKTKNDKHCLLQEIKNQSPRLAHEY